MKLALAASLLLVGAVNAQAPLDGDKFKLFRTYEESIPTEVVEDDAEYLGGGFIDGNDLYVVAAAERLTSKLIRVPLTRDGKQGSFAFVSLLVIAFCFHAKPRLADAHCSACLLQGRLAKSLT